MSFLIHSDKRSVGSPAVKSVRYEHDHWQSNLVASLDRNGFYVLVSHGGPSNCSRLSIGHDELFLSDLAIG